MQDLSFKDESVTTNKNKLELATQSETQAKGELISAKNRITELENEMEGLGEEKRILQDEIDRCTSRIRKLETQLEASREERKRYELFLCLHCPSMCRIWRGLRMGEAAGSTTQPLFLDLKILKCFCF